MITVRVSAANSASRVALPFFSGRNPSNTNRSQGNPEATSAGTKAVAPGRQTTSIPASRQARESMKPGSEIPGVPASETSASLLPLSSSSTRPATALCSLLR